MKNIDIKEYVTTNIRLLKRDLKTLKQEALTREKSVNALVRELIHEHFRGEKTHGKAVQPRRSIWDLPKRAKKTGDPHLAMKVDEIAYGK